MACEGLGVILSPEPPSAGSQTATAASNPQATGAATSGTTTGSGSGGGSSNTGSGSGPNSDSGASSSDQSPGSSAHPGPYLPTFGQMLTLYLTENRLTTAELIGICIGSVSAIATIIGVWVTIKKRKGRGNPSPAPAPAYAPVQNIHVASLYHGPPPGYQPPPAYHTVHHVGWRK